VGARFLAGLAGCALLVVAGTAAAGPGRITAPGSGDTLTSGELVVVRWEALPAGVDEFELLLVVDDASGSQVRLSSQLAATRSSFLWRVPNLPGERARLLLRYGLDGREVEAEPGPPFAIRCSLEQPLEAVGFQAGEWWLAREIGGSWLPPSLTGRELSEGQGWGRVRPAVALTRSQAGASPASSALGPSADSCGERDRDRELLLPAGRRPRDAPLRP
jgi:hypothetical protein